MLPAIRLVLLPLALAAGAPAAAQTRFLPTDGSPNDRYGWEVSLDAAGDRLAVGSRFANQTFQDEGAVYVYVRSGTDWTLEARLESPDLEPGGRFGSAVGLDAAGDTLAVGSMGADEAGLSDAGAVYVFERTGTSWSSVARMASTVPVDGANLGTDLALAADGDTVAVGAVGYLASFDGQVSVFANGASGWTEEALLLPPAGNYGRGVALSGDGDTLACIRGTNPFELHVYDRTGTSWSAVDVVDTNAYLGIALDGSGDRMVASRIGVPVPTVRFYARTGGAWSQTGELVESDPYVAGFGYSAAMNAAGDVAVVGAHTSGIWESAAFVYTWDGTSWSETARVYSPGGIGTYNQSQNLYRDDFAFSVDLDAAGDTLAASAIYDDENGKWAGAAWVIERDQAFSYCSAKVNSLGCAGAISGSGIASAASPAAFDVGATNVLNFRNGLLFYGTNGPAYLTLSTGLFCAAPPFRRTGFQNAGGSPPPVNDCSGAFNVDFNAWIQSGLDPALVAGGVVNAQYWARDPAHPDGTGVVLTDALQFAIGL